jgi:adenylate kinase family enzyme
MRYHAFLSYNHQDVGWAKHLYRRLGRFRIAGTSPRIFFADYGVAAGQSITRAVGDALEQSQHLLIVATPAWISSEWCKFESQVALWRDPSSAHRTIIPLIVRDCDLPFELRPIRSIDFRDQSRYEPSLHELVKALRATASESSRIVGFNHDRDVILHEPILPWLSYGGPNFDFLWPEMIIDPLVWTRKHPAPQRRLSNWVDDYAAVTASSVAVVGEPGVGKTTALRWLALSENSRLPEHRKLLHFRDLTSKVDSLVTEATQSKRFLCIIDGLDEAGAEHIEAITSALARLSEANALTIIASRTDYFERQYEILKAGLANLEEVLELDQWQDRDIVEFTSRYAARIGQPGLAVAVTGLLERVHGTRIMLGNPMRLTLLLYLIAMGTNVETVNFEQPYSLYDTFYREWIRKERSRGTGGYNPTFIRAAHTEIAHRLNEFKGEVVVLGQLLDDIVCEDKGQLLADTAFQGLLTKNREDDPGQWSVPSFGHETIGEYLIARDILESFGGTVDQLRRALRVTMTHDVNSFVRSGLQVAAQSTVIRYFSNLSAKYRELLPDENGSQQAGALLDQERAERLRQQILYYIGRMPLDVFPDILRQAFREEASPLLRRAAALGAILHGDFLIEQEYMAFLDEPAEALLNRSVQMVNFGDVHADMHNFVDNGQDWSRTRAVIFERLAEYSVRNIRLRQWDIKTLRSFYRSRQYRDKLTERERSVLDNVSVSDPSSPERSAALQQQNSLLRQELAEVGSYQS